MPQYKVLVARYPFNHIEHDDIADYFAKLVWEMKSDPRVGPAGALGWKQSGTPTPAIRNASVEAAKQARADFLMMIDSDMTLDDMPDHLAKPFWKTAFEFMVNEKERLKYGINYSGPCVVAAPYCSGPPFEDCLVFKWIRAQGDHPNPDFKLVRFERGEAAMRTGIEEVAALPTGCMLIDMRVFDQLKPPYFYYEYDEPHQTHTISTEDVTFTRDVSMANIPVFVAWDCWAGHNKDKRVRKPQVMYKEDVREKFAEAVMQGYSKTKRVQARPKSEGAQHGNSNHLGAGQSGGRVCDSGGIASPSSGCDQVLSGGACSGTQSECREPDRPN